MDDGVPEQARAVRVSRNRVDGLALNVQLVGSGRVRVSRSRTDGPARSLLRPAAATSLSSLREPAGDRRPEAPGYGVLMD